MAVRETSAHLRYVVDTNGEKTDVVIPLTTWRELLLAWREMVELREDEEDTAILKDWLERRATGRVETVSLAELERELIADGLLPR